MTNKIIKGGKYAYKGVKMTGNFLYSNIAKPLCRKVIQGVGHLCKVLEDNMNDKDVDSKENKENNPKPKVEENNPEIKTEENEENKSLFSSTNYPHYDSLLLKNNDNNNNIGNNVIGYLPYDNNFNINNNIQMQNNYQGQNAPLPEYYNKFGNNNNIYKKPDYFIPDN